MANPDLMKDIQLVFFQEKTGNSSLRSHLESFHKTEYLQYAATMSGLSCFKDEKDDGLESGNSTTHGGESGNTPPRQPFSQSQFLKHSGQFYCL